MRKTPEEEVRQYFLSLMITSLGYPASLIVVERKVSELFGNTYQKSQMPSRRVDILCYTDSLTPLLLIECKAAAFSQKALQQVLGYNHYIGASFVAVASPGGIQIMGPGGVPFFTHLPAYAEIAKIS